MNEQFLLHKSSYDHLTKPPHSLNLEQILQHIQLPVYGFENTTRKHLKNGIYPLLGHLSKTQDIQEANVFLLASPHQHNKLQLIALKQLYVQNKIVFVLFEHAPGFLCRYKQQVLILLDPTIASALDLQLMDLFTEKEEKAIYSSMIKLPVFKFDPIDEAFPLDHVWHTKLIPLFYKHLQSSTYTSNLCVVGLTCLLCCCCR
jgi:hypothetical protein